MAPLRGRLYIGKRDGLRTLDCTEIFGPLAAIQTFTQLDDALARANDTDWGLVGYVITRDVDGALNVSEQPVDAFIWGR
jgi:succinate-semialdehyde dehydrogenase / glutarate-semialdehyde dehydrogenase